MFPSSGKILPLHEGYV